MGLVMHIIQVREFSYAHYTSSWV